jgi:4-amino-4-deoxy-L-arabinose transferase-like glycosyltransferase
MCIFDIAAVILICRGLEGSNRWLNLTIAGICIVLAVLTKGPVGLFPLATPVIYWFVFRKHQLQSVILWTLYLLAVIAAIFFILSEISASRFLLYSYLNEQLFSSLAGKREHVDSSIGRFELLIFLLTELLPALVLTLLLFITGKLLKIKNSKYAIEHKTAVFFLLMGLCASLPIMVSIKQRSFYLVPSIPFYVTGLGMLIYPYISALTQKYTLSAGKMKILNAALLLATAGGVFYLLPKAEMVGRDEQTIKDVKLISTIITPRDTIATCTEMEQDYPFRAYVERYGRIEIKRKKLYRYVVVNREMCREDYTDSIMKMGYAKMNILTGKYDLYENRKIPVAKKDTIN